MRRTSCMLPSSKARRSIGCTTCLMVPSFSNVHGTLPPTIVIECIDYHKCVCSQSKGTKRAKPKGVFLFPCPPWVSGAIELQLHCRTMCNNATDRYDRFCDAQTHPAGELRAAPRTVASRRLSVSYEHCGPVFGFYAIKRTICGLCLVVVSWLVLGIFGVVAFYREDLF